MTTVIPIVSSGASLPAPALTPQITYNSASIPPLKNIGVSSMNNNTEIIPPISQLKLKPKVEIIDNTHESSNYQGLVSNSSLENNLYSNGYTPTSKIVLTSDNNQKKAQYIKAINKNGQKVYIYIDVPGYTTVKSTDLTLLKNNDNTVIPHSLKSGAVQCAGKDVSGVAFECGSNSVCTILREDDDLTPKESNYVFVEKQPYNHDNTIMSYPIIRLSELKEHPDLILENTNTVIIRLRNAAYSKALQELAATEEVITNLNNAFLNFNRMREDVATKLNGTVSQLKKWNQDYMKNPPTTDIGKEKHRILKHNLALRNDNVELLLRLTTKVADIKEQIDEAASKIIEMTEVAEQEFADVDKAVTE